MVVIARERSDRPPKQIGGSASLLGGKNPVLRLPRRPSKSRQACLSDRQARTDD